MYWLSEHLVNHLRSRRLRLPSKIPLGPVIIVPVRPKIPHVQKDNLAFPFPCCWSSSTHLYSLIRFISQRTLLTSILVKHFLKSCSASRLTLKILIVTSSKSPSISLNISQYLSEYVFKVSPSYMDINNKESKGWETLLHVIKRDPNARCAP